MIINIRKQDLNKRNPVAYRMSKETGIFEQYIEFTRKAITVRYGFIVYGNFFNTPCLERLYLDLASRKSPKGCSFYLDDYKIDWIHWALDTTRDYYLEE